MMRLFKEWRGTATGMAAMVLLFAGMLLLQQRRSSWPFIAPESSSPPPHGPLPASAKVESGAHAGHAGAGKPPPGYAPLTIDPARAGGLQLATAPVEQRAFTKVLRTVGVVTLDETRSAHVHSKVRGWIDGIHVNFVGRKVSAGEPLCSIYSQDVYAAEIEFLSILERTSPRPVGTGPLTHVVERDPLLAASRRRLALWDVPESEIARLETTREPRRTFPLLAPRAGTVFAKEAIEGMFVDPSIELYTLSDISKIWVLVDVYEADVPYVHVGDWARLKIEGIEAPIEAKVAFLYPTIDEATRTLKARFVLDNRAGRIRPGAFVSVAMDLRLGSGLEIPESGVIRTGARSLVFVVHGEHGEHFEPREVTLGPLIGDHYRIDEGLSVGERVAVGAQFLLDSESRLRASSAPGGGHAH